LLVAVAAACVTVVAPLSRAQAVRRVVILDDAAESVRARNWTGFRKKLADLGWVEGRNVLIQAKYADGDPSRLDALAIEVASQRPDVIVVVTTTVALAAKRATSDIPIVALGPADPVKSGLIASLSRPGGNLTGAAQNQAEIAGKWLDLVGEIQPRAKSIAYLTDRGNPGEMLVFRELEARGKTRGLTVEAFDGVTPNAVDQSFAAIAGRRTDALIVATTASLAPHRLRIVEAAARAGLPAIYARREYAEVGGLMSYGTEFNPVFDKGAEYVDRILRGTRAGDLPFEMASTFTLVLNLKTARRLGLAIPQSVRIRADEVIE